MLDGPRAASALRDRLFLVSLPVVTDVAAALRSIGDATAVDVAIGGLSEEPYTRRLAAARALAVLRDPRARGPLCAALSDPIAGVRAATLRALAVLGPESDTANECLALLDDADAQVRIAAIRAVMRIDPQHVGRLDALVGDPDLLVRREVAQHAGALGAPAARLFTDVGAEVRQAAARAAGRQQIGLLAMLIAEDPSSEVRRAAARSLGQFDSSAAVDGLLTAIEDRDSLVRATAIRSLQHALTHSGAVTRLAQQLASARPERRRWSLHAVAHLNVELESSDVWRLADDPEPEVRHAVICTAMVLLRDPEPLLLYMATDPDVGVRESARTRVARWRA